MAGKNASHKQRLKMPAMSRRPSKHPTMRRGDQGTMIPCGHATMIPCDHLTSGGKSPDIERQLGIPGITSCSNEQTSICKKRSQPATHTSSISTHEHTLLAGFHDTKKEKRAQKMEWKI